MLVVMQLQLYFKRLRDDAILPTRGSDFSAGLDLYASHSVILETGSFKTISTGISVAIPEGYYGRIAPRSGLAAKFGIDVLAGVVDSDYRGEVGVILANFGQKDFEIKQGDRVAQFIIEKIILPEPVFVEDLPQTNRGEGGFGSTGI